MPELGRDFKTILPPDETHRDILAVRGELPAAQGMAPLTIWEMHRYEQLPYWAKPFNTDKPQLNFSLLGNQFRSADLLLTNASGKSKNVTLQFKNAPQNVQAHAAGVFRGMNALIPIEAKIILSPLMSPPE